MKQITEIMFRDIMNKQLELAWYNLTLEDVKDYDKNPDIDSEWKPIQWQSKFPITQEKYDEFEKWLTEYLKKNKFSKIEMRWMPWFLLNYWLSISNN